MAKKETKVYYGTGRRKSSVARVRLIPGTGKITINGGTFRALNTGCYAVNNFGAKREDLVIKETYINEGRTLKRRKAASHSRVAKNYHRTSHIYVCVTDNMTEKED